MHLAVCTRTGLPLAWHVETARRNESLFVAPLLDALHARGFEPETCAMDKGYDNNRVMDETRERGCIPIVCLRKGRPIPLTAIPYDTDEWKRLYRGRSAVEREFGRLKNEYGLTPLRTRGGTVRCGRCSGGSPRPDGCSTQAATAAFAAMGCAHAQPHSGVQSAL